MPPYSTEPGRSIEERYPHVNQVAPLHLEPLHLLVKSDVAALIKGNGLVALGGREINTGVSGSGTHVLATMLLRFLGMHSSKLPGPTGVSASQWPNHYIESLLSYEQMLSTSDVTQLPDAIFSVSSLPSAFAKEMIERHNYELVELPFSDAFALDAFDFSATASSQTLERAFKQFDRSTSSFCPPHQADRASRKG